MKKIINALFGVLFVMQITICRIGEIVPFNDDVEEEVGASPAPLSAVARPQDLTHYQGASAIPAPLYTTPQQQQNITGFQNKLQQFLNSVRQKSNNNLQEPLEKIMVNELLAMPSTKETIQLYFQFSDQLKNKIKNYLNNTRDDKGNTLLHKSIRYDNLKKLIVFGANPNLVNNNRKNVFQVLKDGNRACLAKKILNWQAGIIAWETFKNENNIDDINYLFHALDML